MKLKYGLINEKINQIRTQGIELSNIVVRPKLDESLELDCICSEKSIIFWYLDNEVLRGIFASSDECELVGMMKECPKRIVFEYPTRTRDEMKVFFHNSGCQKIVTQVRVSVIDVKPYLESEDLTKLYDEKLVQFSKIEDAKKINKLLHEVFDERVSHLPSDEELIEEIKAGNVYSNEAVSAILQIRQEGIKLYINQIINKSGDKKIIHSMLQGAIKNFVNSGKKYVYAWINEDNVASLRFHAKYGLNTDGMYCEIWERC